MDRLKEMKNSQYKIVDRPDLPGTFKDLFLRIHTDPVMIEKYKPKGNGGRLVTLPDYEQDFERWKFYSTHSSHVYIGDDIWQQGVFQGTFPWKEWLDSNITEGSIYRSGSLLYLGTSTRMIVTEKFYDSL